MRIKEIRPFTVEEIIAKDIYENKKEIKIKYFSDKIDKLVYIDGKSDWIDLRSAEDVCLKAGEFKLIPVVFASLLLLFLYL